MCTADKKILYFEYCDLSKLQFKLSPAHLIGNVG